LQTSKELRPLLTADIAIVSNCDDENSLFAGNLRQVLGVRHVNLTEKSKRRVGWLLIREHVVILTQYDSLMGFGTYAFIPTSPWHGAQQGGGLNVGGGRRKRFSHVVPRS
jgi:hypothetical protein